MSGIPGEFLKFCMVGIWRQIILCWGGLSCALQNIYPVPGFYTADASSMSLVRATTAGEQNQPRLKATALNWALCGYFTDFSKYSDKALCQWNVLCFVGKKRTSVTNLPGWPNLPRFSWLHSLNCALCLPAVVILVISHDISLHALPWLSHPQKYFL